MVQEISTCSRSVPAAPAAILNDDHVDHTELIRVLVDLDPKRGWVALECYQRWNLVENVFVGSKEIIWGSQIILEWPFSVIQFSKFIIQCFQLIEWMKFVLKYEIQYWEMPNTEE